MKDDACLFPLTCAPFMLTLSVVRALPFANGIQDLSPTPQTIHSSILYTLTNLSLIFSFQLGINLWKGMLKRQPYSACFFYIVYIDVIHNLMHNTYMAVSYYTHNDLFIFRIHLRHILAHKQDLRHNASRSELNMSPRGP
jgi:hypothetical protein